MRPSRKAIWTATALFVVGATACGDDSPTGPSETSGPSITISGNTVTPTNLTVPRGSQVLFVNNDSRDHDMQSDPHPEHTDCPAINVFLRPGERRQTGNLNTARVCGYHDHLRDTVQGLRGTITIQ
jgi:plastocyanin